MHVIVVNFEVQKEHVEDFRAAILKNAELSLTTEEGCRQFDVCWDPKDETKVFLYEVYDDEAAFEVHHESSHFKAFAEQTAPWTSGKSVNVYKRAFPTL